MPSNSIYIKVKTRQDKTMVIEVISSHLCEVLIRRGLKRVSRVHCSGWVIPLSFIFKMISLYYN